MVRIDFQGYGKHRQQTSPSIFFLENQYKTGNNQRHIPNCMGFGVMPDTQNNDQIRRKSEGQRPEKSFERIYF